MLKLGEINIKDLYLGTTPIIRAYLGTSLVYQKAPESPLVASYRCYDKTNEDEDRAVLKDLTGNGHDITLNNFAFGGMSGYGGYIWNFNSFNRNKWEHTDSKIILDYNNIPELDSTVFEAYAKAEGTQIIKGTKIKVSGIKNGGQFVLYSAVNTTDVSLYPTLRNQVLIKEDGIYELKDLIIPTEYLGYLADFYYGLKEIAIQEGELITIEQIPQYPKALVSDGVDDYGICRNMPIFNKESGFTIIAIRKHIKQPTHSTFVCKSALTNEYEYLFEHMSANSDGTLQYPAVGCFGLLKNIEYPNLFTYMTSQKYNSVGLLAGNSTVFDNKMYLFSNKGSVCMSAALYALDIYNRDLTDEEIEEAKAKMIAEYEEKTGDLSLSLVAAWSAKGKTNDDEDRATNNYNGQKINTGGQPSTNIFSVGSLNPKTSNTPGEFSNMTFYSAYLFNRTLTDQEIKKFIRENIDPQYLLPSEIPTPDVYYDFSTGSNDDENRETIVDLSGNGNDANAYNFAWSGMSGYGGYPINFVSVFNKTHSDRCEGTRTSDKITINTFYNRGNSLIVFTECVKTFTEESESYYIPKYKLRLVGLPENTIFKIDYVDSTHTKNVVLLNTDKDGIYDVPEFTLTYNNGVNLYYRYSITNEKLITEGITGINMEIELIPEYPGALCFDGTDDYLSLDFPTGYKTVLINYQHDDVKGDTTTKVCYDLRLENNNGKFSIESFVNTINGLNSGLTLVNGTNVMSLPNTAIPSGKRLFILATNEGITEEDITLTQTTIGRLRWSKVSCSNMRLYKFLGFKEVLTEEQIHNVILKYNLLDGVDYAENI